MKITYLFPGQGSQTIGMGKEFFETQTMAKEMFEEASEVLKIDMKKLLFEENTTLNETEYSQPAILLVSMIAKQLFEASNATLSLGHSLGEITALCSTGALEFAKAIKLVHERGLLMKKACEGKNAGMMAVLGLDLEKLSTLVETFRKEGKSIWIANINNQSQIVLAGKKDDLHVVSNELKNAGAKRAIVLPMSVASHCPLLEDISADFNALLELHVKDSFSTPIISNVMAKPYESKKDACELLTKQLTSPVLYTECIKYCEAKTEIFVEFGASVLGGLNRKITKNPTYSITDCKSLETTLNKLQG